MTSLRDRVSGIIAGYDAQGWHRTGTGVDRMSCEWLAMQVGRAGGSPATEAFQLERVEPGDCYAEIGETRIPGTPAFDGVHRP